MNKIGICKLCGEGGTELHHIIYKSRCKALENCKNNLIELCYSCHRGAKGVHNNNKMDKQLREEFKRKCLVETRQVTGDRVTEEVLGRYLCITEKEVHKLCKTLNKKEGKISIEELSYKLGLGGFNE